MTTTAPRHWRKPRPRHKPSLTLKRTVNIIVHAVGLEKDRGRLLLSVRACRAYLVSLCYTCNLSYVRFPVPLLHYARRVPCLRDSAAEPAPGYMNAFADPMSDCDRVRSLIRRCTAVREQPQMATNEKLSNLASGQFDIVARSCFGVNWRRVLAHARVGLHFPGCIQFPASTVCLSPLNG